MSTKTENNFQLTTHELPKSYLSSLVIGSVIVLLLVFLGPLLIPRPLSIYHIEGRSLSQWLYPWMMGGAQTVMDGLLEFSGKSLRDVESTIYFTGLASLLFSGVVAPTLALLLMGKKTSDVVRALFLLSTVLVVTFAAAIVPSGYTAYRVHKSAQNAQAVQSNKDNIINELNVIRWKLREYRILPKTRGGGGDSFEGYVLPAALAETHNAKYSVKSSVPVGEGKPRSDVVVVRAVSQKYADAEVEVFVRGDGQMYGWKYAGQFK